MLHALLPDRKLKAQDVPYGTVDSKRGRVDGRLEGFQRGLQKGIRKGREEAIIACVRKLFPHTK